MTKTYETLPATKMLATACLVCGRPLLDSVSVEIGIGPVCREKTGYTISAPWNRTVANRLIHNLATGRVKMDGIMWALDELAALGFSKLARTVAERFATITITYVGDRFEVAAPYNAGAVDAFRALSSRRFETKNKTWSFHNDDKPGVWAALCKHYPNAIAVGPLGAFVCKVVQ